MSPSWSICFFDVPLFHVAFPPVFNFLLFVIYALKYNFLCSVGCEPGSP